MLEVKKREGESASSLIYRFNKKVQRGGILIEIKKRRFHDRPLNRRKRRLSAINREQKKAEILKAKKMGII